MSTTLIFLLMMIPATFLLGANDVLVRKVVRTPQVNQQALLALEFLGTGVLMLIALAFVGIPEIKPGFWTALAITGGLNIFAQWAWYTAFKKEEASLISPLRLLTPPIVLLTGLLVLGEQPTLGGIVGVLVTIIGLWILLQSEAMHTKIRLREVMRKPGVLLGIWGAISFALSLPYDKKAVLTSSTFFTVPLVFLIIGVGNGMIAMARSKEKTKFFSGMGKNRGTIMLMVIIHSFASVLSYGALNYAFAAYAASIKRLWSLWAVLLSGKFLKERNIGRKLLATGIMLAGIAVTVILG